MHLPTVYEHPTTLDQPAPLSSTVLKRPMLSMAPKPHLSGQSLTSGFLTDGPHMHGFHTSSQPAHCAQAVSNSSLLIPAQAGDAACPTYRGNVSSYQLPRDPDLFYNFFPTLQRARLCVNQNFTGVQGNTGSQRNSRPVVEYEDSSRAC